MFNVKIFFLVGLVACLKIQISASFSCKNEQGEDVDWFILLKAPRQTGDSDPKLAAGGGYGYIDNKATGPGWFLAEHDIGDVESAIGKTFKEVYEKPENYSYIQYNDAKPEGVGSDSIIYAHAKGALVWNNEDAVWIVHSAPKFLPLFHSKEYEYPKGGKIYGQNFLCITLDTASNVNKILYHLIKMKAQIYGNHISSKLDEKIQEKIQDNINILAKKMKSISAEPKKVIDEITKEDLGKLLTEITSKGGEKFKVISKSRKHHVDIWQKIAQPLLGAKELVVKYWTKLQKVTALLLSECKIIRTLNAEDMEMKFTNDEKVIKWEDNDHSKWGICTKGGDNCYCAGDMNRATSQYKRGGGVVCIFNKNVFETFSNTIKTESNCKNKVVPYGENK